MKRLPRTVYNLVTLFGAGMATFALSAIAILYVLDNVIVRESSQYLGIVILVVLPALMMLGLILIPVGMFRERRRLARGKDPRPIVIDLGDPRHSRAMVIFIAGTSVFLLLSTMGMYGTYEYTESVQFCGELCHVMEPENVAFKASPHAETHCVDCHVGSGADWYFKSKISGARQLLQLARGTYSKPIPTPVHQLRPANDICRDCHWPGKAYESTVKIYDHFLGDEANSPWRIALLLNVGGTSQGQNRQARGMHWHNDPGAQMTFIHDDEKRMEIRELVWSSPAGPVVYSRKGVPMTAAEKDLAGLEKRVREMDCMDCHNRPAHRYRSPMESVNHALATGKLDAEIPWIKREAVEALSTERFEKKTGADSAGFALRTGYAERDLEVDDRTVEVLEDLFRANQFPAMRVRWNAYPSHEGHFFDPGCFRCHGSDLQTPEGKTISADCNLCHSIVAQGPPDAMERGTPQESLDFRHPIDIGAAETTLGCFECHIGDNSVYLGGKDPAEREDLEE